MKKYYCPHCSRLVAQLEKGKIRTGTTMTCRECANPKSSSPEVDHLRKVFGMS